MKPIDIQFQYTPDDYEEFTRHHFWKGRGKRLFLWMGVMFFIVLIANARMIQATRLLSWIVPVVLFFALWYFLFKRTVRKSFALNTELTEPRHCTIGTDKIVMRGRTFTSEYEWDPTYALSETKNLFLLFVSPVSAIMMPKRALTEAQQRDLVGLARTKGIVVSVK